MFVIIGATGQVGRNIAQCLLEKQQPVRIIVRNPDKAKILSELGAMIHVGDIDRPSDVQNGFKGADVVFLLDPPAYHEPNVEEITRRRLDTLKAAIIQNGVKKIVVLTSGGIHRHDIDIGNLRLAQIWEDGLRDLNIPVTSLRPTWFMENWIPAIGMAKKSGRFPSMVRHIDRPMPQIAVRDIAKIATETMLSTWTGFQVLELEGPQRYSVTEIANAVSKRLNKGVHPCVITKDALPSMLLSINTHFNSIHGWVAMLDFVNGESSFFEHDDATVKGTTTLEEFLSSVMWQFE